MTAKLPNGFSHPDHHQREAFFETGSVHGAAKVITDDRGDLLGIRLRPPRTWGDVVSPTARAHAIRLGFKDQPGDDAARAWYQREYNRGWESAGRPGDSREWNSGFSSAAFDDGYLDRAAGRAKWHLTYCVDHDYCGEG